MNKLHYEFANYYNAKGAMPYDKLIIIFEHDQLIKNLARPEFLQENRRYGTIATWEDTKRTQGTRMKKDENKKGQRKWKKEIVLKNRNIEDGVILRGRGCNIPLMPKIFCKYKGYCTCFW